MNIERLKALAEAYSKAATAKYEAEIAAFGADIELRRAEDALAAEFNNLRRDHKNQIGSAIVIDNVLIEYTTGCEGIRVQRVQTLGELLGKEAA